jgi:hypothetical protein
MALNFCDFGGKRRDFAKFFTSISHFNCEPCRGSLCELIQPGLWELDADPRLVICRWSLLIKSLKKLNGLRKPESIRRAQEANDEETT